MNHGPLQRLVRPRHASALEETLQLVARKLHVAQDAGEQPGTERFAGVNWNNGRAAVEVPNEVMTALGSDHLKTGATERSQQFLAADGGIRSHAPTVTRCTPTKSRR